MSAISGRANVDARPRSTRPVSLRTSLFVLVAACVLPLALIAAPLALAHYRLQRDWLHLDTVLMARRYAAELDRELAAIESGMRVLASAPELVDDDLAAFHQRASAALRGQPVTNYLLTDRAGRQRLNTLMPFGASLPATGTPARLGKVFESGGSVVTDLFTGPVTGKPVVAIGVPVFRDDEVVYSLNIGLAPERIAAILGRHPLPEGWVAAVLDGSGTIVARTREEQRFVGQKAVPDVVQQIALGQEGSIETQTKEGIAVVSSFSRSAVSDWSVAVGAPKAVVEAALVKLAGWVGAGLTLALVLGGWLAHRVARRVSHAVNDLNEAALSLVHGRPVVLPTTQLVEAEAVGRAIGQAADVLARAQHLAHHDVLTGLCNRTLLEENLRRQIAAAKRTARPFVLLAIDLDEFKAVNDAHGHGTGDWVLQQAAARIVATVRPYDLVARIGGDEFVVLLPDIELESAQHLADRLVNELSLPYGEQLPHVSASIGIASFPASGMDARTLLEQADRALYAAKGAGRRRALLHS